VVGEMSQFEAGIDTVEQHGGRVKGCLCLYAADPVAAARWLGERDIALLSATQSEVSDLSSSQDTDGLGVEAVRDAAPLSPEQIAERLQRNQGRVADCL